MNSRILIPAAGFGKRVGGISSKELLPHPKTGRPMILEAVEKAKLLGEPMVITRKEKVDLIEYLVKHNIEFELIDATREWPDTILAAKEYWLDANLILLPDTDYLPLRVAQDLLLGLETDEISVTLGVFKESDFSQWGMIDPTSSSLCISDKPSVNKNSSVAWGLIAFRIEDGEVLFEAIASANQDKSWKDTGLKYKTYQLDLFKDLTR